MRAMEMAVVVLGLLAMVQQSMQLNLKSPPLPPSPRTIRASAERQALGLITTSESVEKALTASDDFVATSSVDLFGRRFVMGTIHGDDVVFVRSSGNPSVHVGMTVQIMATNFDLRGIIHLGLAGTTNDALTEGTVSVPRHVGFTGSMNWLSMDSNVVGELNIGEFNYPENGENRLGSIKYEESDIYYNGKIHGPSYWIHPNSEWRKVAKKIQIDGEVVHDLNASSSDIFVNNPAYREFIFNRFRCATVDRDSAAAGFGAKNNNLRFISFVGISDKAGAGRSPSNAKQLASKNVAAAVVNFIQQLMPRYACGAVDK